MLKNSLVFFWIVLISGCTSLEKSMSLGHYNDVIKKYEGSNPDKIKADLNFMIGEAYRKSNRLHKSIPYYEAAVKKGADHDMAYIYYALSLKSDKRYEEARNVLNEFLGNRKISKEKSNMEMAQKELLNIDQLENLKTKDTYYRIKNLEAVNTAYAEYSPIYRNKYLYFTSNRQGGKIYRNTGSPFTDIYRVKTRGAKVSMNSLNALDPVINHDGVNEGSLAIAPDGLSLIYAKSNNGKASGTNNVNLFFTRFRNGRWIEPKSLSLSDEDHWDSTPALSSDGKTLYFASDRPGGSGGADIYSAKLNRRGDWVDVRNMGSKINTTGNEMFPSVSEDGSLYFSSDGHPGFGGLDIFKATRRSGEITVANLGKPMNSNADDFGFSEYNLTRGFFSSNRSGGKGDDDIYTFVNDDPDLKIVNYFLTGTTQTLNDANKKIPVGNSKISLIDQEGNILDEAFTPEEGKFKFRVYTEENYTLLAEKTGYWATRSKFSTIGKTVKKSELTQFITNVDFGTEIMLSPVVKEESIVLKNIYYDRDKYNIRDDAKIVLDSLITMLEDNPQISIELSSHTDARQTNEYNRVLSMNRAKSAVSYIVRSGINSKRIVPMGYGETQLIIKNAKTEEEHQINRRTEFKVIGYDPKINTGNEAGAADNDEYDRFFGDDTDIIDKGN